MNIEKKKIYLGDCLEIMPFIESKSIDMILCDLPYGTTACKWDNVIPFDKLWENYNRIIKDNGAIVLFGSEPFSSYLRLSNIKNYKYDWVWDKVLPCGHLNAKKRPMMKKENILIFGKNINYYPQGLIYNPRKKSRSSKSPGSDNYGKFGDVNISEWSGYPTDILKFKRECGLHPTQKPVALCEYLIKTYTNEEDLVLDNCMGSGSTLIACMNTNRNYIGIEKEEKYFNIANNRIKEAERCKV